MAYDVELAAALEAADLAGTALKDLYARFEAIPNAPASISTDADRQAQEIILTHLRRLFPNDAFRAEEKTPTLAEVASSGARLWVVDPIDGTRGFARKNGEFSVMIGFVVDARAVAGVVLEPATDRLTYASIGDGCYRRDVLQGSFLCRVREETDPAQATLVQTRTSRPNYVSGPVQALKPSRVIETYSMGIKLAMVARGEADLYVTTYDVFHDWDVCAGHILVEEAGGRVTNLSGKELHYGAAGAVQTNGLVAGYGPLHAAALAALR